MSIKVDNEKIYLHSLQKTPQKVNKEFAEWFVDLL
jgi:hypothetical protein